MSIQSVVKLLILLSLPTVLAGCFATAAPQQAPAMEKRAGTAPTAAMLPIGNTNDATVAGHVTASLRQCLTARNVLRFADPQQVEATVSRSGVDLTRMFGQKDAVYRDLARDLGVDYVLDGVVTVRKQLTFAGWRKDVDVYVHLHRASDGKKVDSWRSMTDFTWTRGGTALDAAQMAESAANHTCAKMLERTF